MSGPAPGEVPVILVTGASRGIGAAISEALAAAGVRVAVNYKSAAARAEELVARIGNEASAWAADVGDGPAATAMVAGVIEHYGRLDGLVLNAGIWHGGRIGTVPDAEREAVFATALDSAFHLVPAAAPALRETGGRICLVSSVIGLIGFPGDSVYAAAKAGQIGLMRSLAKELGPDGVVVNAVAPGLVETEMTAAVSAGARERMLSRTALGRIGEPTDIATAVRFLMLDSSYVTGQVLVVDGGLGS
jgi:3-oxoacyl-[acyl-carrier protein] reductase